MQITKRFVYILCLGVFLIGVASILNMAVIAFLVYNMICFTLLTIDYIKSSDIKSIEVKRTGADTLSLYAQEKIEMSIYNKGDSSIYVELVDEIPNFYFETIDSKIVKGKIKPHSEEVLSYQLIPKKRGAFKFGSIHIRVLSNLKLCKKQYILELDKEYKVYPNLKDLKKYRMQLYNSRFNVSGIKTYKMKGNGTEFESLKEYVLGDEYRKINWKATAREHKPIVNTYEPEKNQHVYMMIDTGRGMSYEVKGQKKLDLAINTGLILSDIINQNGDQSGLLIFNTDVKQFVKPDKGPVHRQRMLEELYHVEYTKETSNYEEAFRHLKTKDKRRSLVCIFTEFDTIEEAEDMIRALPIISKTNLVLIVLIENHQIKKIADKKVDTLEDEQIFQKGVAYELMEERKKIIRLLNTKGVMCIECEAEKITMNAINQYIQLKNRMTL